MLIKNNEKDALARRQLVANRILKKTGSAMS